MNVQHPANSNQLRQLIGGIVNFDALDPEWTSKHFLNFEYDEAVGKIMYLKNNTVIND